MVGKAVEDGHKAKTMFKFAVDTEKVHAEIYTKALEAESLYPYCLIFFNDIRPRSMSFYAMKCKQSGETTHTETLKQLVDDFEQLYFAAHKNK